jgi:hypothetical protein
MITTASSLKERADEQWDTILELNALSNAHWTVDAGDLDVNETQLCATDSDHGLGICHNEHMDGLCRSCAVAYVTQNLVAGAYISIDVTR